jgi:hypothetical protein
MMGRADNGIRRPRDVAALSSHGIIIVRHYHRVVVARSLRGHRRAVVVAGDCVRAKTPLRSVFTLTSIAPTPFDVAFH